MSKIIKAGTNLILMAVDNKQINGTYGWMGSDFNPNISSITSIRYINDDNKVDFHFLGRSEFLVLNKKNWIRSIMSMMDQNVTT